jgi:hypothetical protein
MTPNKHIDLGLTADICVFATSQLASCKVCGHSTLIEKHQIKTCKINLPPGPSMPSNIGIITLELVTL